ncbi:hypothetical protein AWZ03_012364 [Drosophila navojoa]|uniref:Uncharacterized protein n=1 Tax=Drosophila navojoa TaxID=7232 RepID=A0A484AXK1_DRONA|nr:hypothetical protein AWZ03_012364 [Drosophila navojoa]
MAASGKGRKGIKPEQEKEDDWNEEAKTEMKQEQKTEANEQAGNGKEKLSFPVGETGGQHVWGYDVKRLVCVMEAGSTIRTVAAYPGPRGKGQAGDPPLSPNLF